MPLSHSQAAGAEDGDLDGQRAAGCTPPEAGDGGGQQPVRAAAGGAAEDAVLRRPHQHPVHLGTEPIMYSQDAAGFIHVKVYVKY